MTHTGFCPQCLTTTGHVYAPRCWPQCLTCGTQHWNGPLARIDLERYVAETTTTAR